MNEQDAISFSTGDLIALYGAALSTLLMLVSAYKWLTNGPKAEVTIFNHNETYFGSGGECPKLCVSDLAHAFFR